MDKVSVIIPVFNREKYLEEAVNSIIKQTYNNLDILIYDDGSADNSVKIEKQLAKKDNRIKLFRSKINKGGSYAKKQMIKKSKTKIICYQDSDDISHTKRIEKQLKFIKKGYDLVYCYCQRFNNKKQYTRISKKAQGPIMFRKDMNILPNPNYKLGGGDSDFIRRYKKKHPNYFKINQVLYYIRNHDGKISRMKKKIRKVVSKKYDKNGKKLSYSDLLKLYKKYK